MNIIVHGSLAFDRIMDFPGKFQDHLLPEHIPQLSVSFHIARMEDKRGGTAGNIAYNLYLLGEGPNSFIVSSAGSDFGPYMDFLKKIGLPTTYIAEYNDIPTAVAHMIADKNGNQIAAFYEGAAARWASFDFEKFPPEETMFIFAPRNNLKEVMEYVRECKKRDIRYIFDPGLSISAFSGDQLKEVMDGAFMVTVNDYELELILHKTQLGKEEVFAMTQTFITTLGKQGSLIHTQGQEIQIPMCPATEVKDPTGAGDAYRAGLLKALVLGLPIEVGGKLGAVAAAYCIEHYGTQEYTFTLDEFAARYEHTFNEPCPLVNAL